MTKSALPKPIIIDLPYQSIDDKAEIEKAFVEQLGYETLSAVERETLHYIFDYPTVYVVHSKKRNQHTLRPEYTVYVGETNNIRSRTMQHLREDPKTRVDWKEFQEKLQSDARSVWQYVIGNPHFNKSLTLDVENRLMHYLLGSDAVKNLNNVAPTRKATTIRRMNSARFFSDIWLELNRQDPELFPAEEIISRFCTFLKHRLFTN